jgi:hypothetical protein
MPDDEHGPPPLQKWHRRDGSTGNLPRRHAVHITMNPPVSAKCWRNPALRIVHEQPVEDIGSLTDGRRDYPGGEGRILVGDVAVSLQARRRRISR